MLTNEENTGRDIDCTQEVYDEIKNNGCRLFIAPHGYANAITAMSNFAGEDLFLNYLASPKTPLEPAEDCYQDFAATLAKLFVRKEIVELKSETPKKKRTLIEKRNATIQGQKAHIKRLQNKIDELTKPKTESRWIVYDANGVLVGDSAAEPVDQQDGYQTFKLEVNV
jgi:hypothetical protein